MINSYVCLDLETTGLDPGVEKLIEIGAVKVEEGKVMERFSTLVNPHRPLSDFVQNLTGITEEELQSAPELETVLPKFLEFAGDYILLGHSVLFDYSFVKKAAVEQGLQFERMAVDTLKIARKFLPELESRSLPSLCRYYHLDYTPHRALQDAEATHRLYQCLLKNFYGMEEEKEKVFKPVPQIYKAKKKAPITKAQREQLEKLLEIYEKDKTKYPIQIALRIKDIPFLTRSEASRFVNQLLQQKISH
ncbi:MAG: 3'-5' exonuclease [Lachnospiraceae bacterium]|nr:3'-5' exonuclease [Lachnospiraceae bacterium]